MKNQKGVFKAFVSVSGLIVVDKIIGFIKQVIVASTFGATTETDIINLSQNAISDIQYILSQTLITAFVSIYIHTQQGVEGSVQKSRLFVGDAIKTFVSLSLMISIILFFTSNIIARILAPSYSLALSNSLSQHIRVYSLIICLFTLCCIFRAVLSANKNFVPEQFVSFNQSVVTIVITLFFSSIWGAQSLVVSFFVSTILNTIFLGLLCRNQITIAVSNPIKNRNVVNLFRMIGPLLFGYSLIYINQMVDRMLVSGLGVGVITALSYGSVLSNLITTFITTFCTIIFSYIASEVSASNYKSASSIVGISIKTLSVLFMPISITFVICSQEIVSIVFGHGAFDTSAVTSASLALKGYSIMFVPVVFREIYSRYQYAFQDSKSPTINGSIGIIGNIILSVVLCRMWGVYGVALATSLSVLISAILNMFSARKITKDLSYAFLRIFGIKFLFAIILSTAFGLVVFHSLSAVNNYFRLCAVFISCTIFFVFIFGKEFLESIKDLTIKQNITTSNFK